MLLVISSLIFVYIYHYSSRSSPILDQATTKQHHLPVSDYVNCRVILRNENHDTRKGLLMFCLRTYVQS
jgi:hypothetical protein